MHRTYMMAINNGAKKYPTKVFDGVKSTLFNSYIVNTSLTKQPLCGKAIGWL